MGLTFKKRDDFDELMDTLGVSTVDAVNNSEETLKNKLKEDPFAKFLEHGTAKDLLAGAEGDAAAKAQGNIQALNAAAAKKEKEKLL